MTTRPYLYRLPRDFDDRDWKILRLYWGDKCSFCGEEFPDGGLHQNHWYPPHPRQQDDPNPGMVPRNMLPMCASCLGSKSNRNPHAWLVARFGADKAATIEERIRAYFLVWARATEHDAPRYRDKD